MDASIMKLLEEDEDESMHSGADLDAFQAALNRDIGGDASTSQAPPSDRDLSQLESHSSNQAFQGWQSTTDQDEMKNSQLQQEQMLMQHQGRILSEKELKQHGDVNDPNQKDIQQEVNHLLLHQRQSQDDLQPGQGERIPHQIPQMIEMQVSEPERTHTADGESQYLKLQKMSNQQAMVSDQNRPNRLKQVPFAMLLPVILPQLDNERAMQLQSLYAKLKKNDIPKEGFVRIMRGIVGDTMLKIAVMKIQQPGPYQFHMQGEASAPHSHPRMQPPAQAKFNESQSFPQLHQKGNSESSHSVSSSGQDRDHTSAPVQGLNRQQHQQQQQHLQTMQTAFPMYGSGGPPYHQFSGGHVTNTVSSEKSQTQDFQMKQVPGHQTMGSNQPGGMSQAMNTGCAPKFESPNSISDSRRILRGSISAFANNNASLQQGSIPWIPPISKEQTSGPFSSMGYVKPEPIDHSNDQQHKLQLTSPYGLSSVSADHTDRKFPLAVSSRDVSLEPQLPAGGFLSATSAGPSHSESPSMSAEEPNVQVGSRTSISTPVINSRTSSKKPSAGQKKPLEAVGSSPPPSSKKQKVSGHFADQSIEQLIDVTAVSGVNLREEEEQLFSGPKEDSRVSEASRRVVQEEEEALILQKAPLQKKLAGIMVKCGVKNISNDVERCLSLCVEERMRGFLSNLIRFSQQRVDAEKPRHRTIITSDVRHQLTMLNRKAREEYEKKQAEADKLRKLNEPEDSSNAADGDKEKDENRGKAAKVNREEDDKMRTTAANVAARAAVGGDDMLSKWQLMAEQARQKRDGGSDGASGSQASKDSGGKGTSASGRSTKDLQESGKRGQGGLSSGSRKGRNQVVSPQPRIARTISVKDVISVLEREPQMSKSSLMYRLYDKIHSDPTGE